MQQQQQQQRQHPLPQQQPQEEEEEEDPGMAFLRRLKGVYDHLVVALPAVARQADGSTNERALMQLLAEQVGVGVGIGVGV